MNIGNILKAIIKTAKANPALVAAAVTGVTHLVKEVRVTHDRSTLYGGGLQQSAQPGDAATLLRA